MLNEWRKLNDEALELDELRANATDFKTLYARLGRRENVRATV